MLYYITTIVNRHPEFRTAINQAGELGIYDEMLPSYTVFHEDTETFLTFGLNMCRILKNFQGPMKTIFNGMEVITA